MRNNPLAAALIIIIAIAGLLSYNASVNMIDHVNTKHINGLNHSPFENLSIDTFTKPFTKTYAKVNKYIFSTAIDDSITTIELNNTTMNTQAISNLDINMSALQLQSNVDKNTSNKSLVKQEITQGVQK